MKKALQIAIFLFFSIQSFATHISGGELLYQYMGAGSQPNTSRYKITMRLFRECNLLQFKCAIIYDFKFKPGMEWKSSCNKKYTGCNPMFNWQCKCLLPGWNV